MYYSEDFVWQIILLYPENLKDTLIKPAGSLKVALVLIYFKKIHSKIFSPLNHFLLCAI